MIDTVVQLSRISPFIASIVCILLGIAVYSTQSNSRKHFLFLIFSFILGVWAFACFIQSVTKSYNLALIFDQVLYAAAVFAPPIFLSFTSEFTQKKRNTVMFATYTISFILFFMNFSPVFRDGVVLLFRNRFVTIPAMGWYLYVIFFSVVVSLGVYDLIMLIRRSSGEIKNHAKFILLACMFLILGGISYFALIINLASFPYDSILNLISSIVLAVYEIIIAFAITKTELMDIRVIIGRTLAYGIAGIPLIISFAALNSYPLSIPLAVFANTFLALFWAWGAHRLREVIQTPVDKWLSWYKPDELLNSIVKELGLASEREEAFKIIATQLKNTIKIKQVDIHLEETVEYYEATKTKDGIVIPLFSTKSLEGIIVLGEKVSEDPYDKKDFIFFETLIIQTKAFLDRIHHYESIKRDFEANQKKLYDTERLLARSEKIASMAHLIQEYNHEIRTPLGIIKGRTEELADKPRDLEYLKQFIDLIMKHANRIEDIVGTTSRLSAPKERKEVELDLNEIINNALQLFPPTRVHLTKELNPIPLLMGDREDLQTVFINLIKNAKINS